VRWFKCKHPFSKLAITKAETEVRIDEDFQSVEYHFKCIKCSEELTLGYTRCTGGVEVMLARQHLQKIEQMRKS
jgi:hypothetical protein